jgi:hypothetical protein
MSKLAGAILRYMPSAEGKNAGLNVNLGNLLGD